MQKHEETEAPKTNPQVLAEINDELKTTNTLLRRFIMTQAFWRSFLTGLLTGLGGTVGLAIVLFLIFILLKQLNFVPGVTYIQQILAPFNFKSN